MRCRIVDHVSAEDGQLHATDRLGCIRAWLGELTGDAADLHDGHAHRVREHHGHLQDDTQLLADVDCGEFLETLCAVTCLEEERISTRHLSERGKERARLASEHEWRKSGDLLQRAVEFTGIGPIRLLHGRERLPCRGCPRAAHTNRLSVYECKLGETRRIIGSLRRSGSRLRRRAANPRRG